MNSGLSSSTFCLCTMCSMNSSTFSFLHSGSMTTSSWSSEETLSTDHLNSSSDESTDTVEKESVATRSDLPPIGAFRNVNNLYPRASDLSPNIYRSVRPITDEGIFENVEHYIDIQFHLTREDFINQLRYSLGKYKTNKTTQHAPKHRYGNVRFYTVRITNAKLHEKGNPLAYVVQIDLNEQLKASKWEYSRRFVPGSLLLFTDTDFEEFFCGTVVERDTNVGRILVSFADLLEFNVSLSWKSFVMAESDIYFEPYFWVTRALQDSVEEAFSMKNFIVEDLCYPQCPNYMQDFRTKYVIKGHIFDIFDEFSWPGRQVLNLDSCQYRALQLCLTREFAIVQGAPGTGKTFLGVTIAEVILHNLKVNEKTEKTPILVVCRTDGELDQFLGKVLQFTNRIVRIAGSKSGNQALAPYDLRGRENLKNSRDNAELAKCKSCIRKLLERIHFLNTKRNDMISEPKRIFDLQWIIPFVSDGFRKVFQNNGEFLRWMFGNKRRHTIGEDADQETEHETKYDFLKEMVKNSTLLDKDDMLDNDDLPVEEKFLRELKQVMEWRSENLLKQHGTFGTIPDPSIIRFEDREQLFREWIRELRKEIVNDIAELEREFRQKAEEYENLKQGADLEWIKKSKTEIVGITITSAARLKNVLKNLSPYIGKLKITLMFTSKNILYVSSYYF